MKLVPPVNAARPFDVSPALLRPIAAGMGGYILMVLYPLFVGLRVWGGGEGFVLAEAGYAAVFAVFFAVFAYRYMVRLTLVTKKQDRP